MNRYFDQVDNSKRVDRQARISTHQGEDDEIEKNIHGTARKEESINVDAMSRDVYIPKGMNGSTVAVRVARSDHSLFLRCLPLEEANKINGDDIASHNCCNDPLNTSKLWDGEDAIVEGKTGSCQYLVLIWIWMTDMEYFANVVLVWYNGSKT